MISIRPQNVHSLRLRMETRTSIKMGTVAFGIKNLLNGTCWWATTSKSRPIDLGNFQTPQSVVLGQPSTKIVTNGSSQPVFIEGSLSPYWTLLPSAIIPSCSVLYLNQQAKAVTDPPSFLPTRAKEYSWPSVSMVPVSMHSPTHAIYGPQLLTHERSRTEMLYKMIASVDPPVPSWKFYN